VLKRLWRKFGPNPLDALLTRASERKHKRMLIVWNRGLGDIPLGLYALVYRIREFIPDAAITFITRSDLAPGFALLKGIKVLEAPHWQRGAPIQLEETLEALGMSRNAFDLLIEQPDPTYWLKWQLGLLVPRLQWNPAWDTLWHAFPSLQEGTFMGVHVQTETHYQTNKNWPISHWEELFRRVKEKGVRVVLFGFHPTPPFSADHVVDLRGKTTLFEMLSIIKERCTYLVVPDSGVLSLTYFLEAAFSLKIVSLWADPCQGVLKQNVPSPNPKLAHVPLIAHHKDLSTISVSEVEKSLYG